jgi:hypothetical protein
MRLLVTAELMPGNASRTTSNSNGWYKGRAGLLPEHKVIR